MSKHKKHNDLSQLTRKQLCDRIVPLEKHNAYLEKLVQDDVTIIKELRDIAHKATNALGDSVKTIKRLDEISTIYKRANKFLIVALILSGLSHLIYLFI
jgi:hypothetical protein